MGTVTADEGLDPRPTGQAGERPNENVPTTATGALPRENTEIPTGNWIRHDNGWIFSGNPTREYAVRFADASRQVYTIAGESFVLDGFEDWDYRVNENGVPIIGFSYTTPPEPKGTSYEIRWEFEWKDEPLPNSNVNLDFFPLVKTVTVVGRDGGGNGGQGGNG